MQLGAEERIRMADIAANEAIQTRRTFVDLKRVEGEVAVGMRKAEGEETVGKANALATQTVGARKAQAKETVGVQRSVDERRAKVEESRQQTQRVKEQEGTKKHAAGLNAAVEMAKPKCIVQ